MSKKSITILFIVVYSFLAIVSQVCAAEIRVNIDSAKLPKGSTLGSTMTGDRTYIDESAYLKSTMLKSTMGEPEFNLNTEQDKDILVLSKDKNIILLAHTFDPKDVVTMDEVSTAVSLVLFSPTLHGFTSIQQQQVIPLIKAQPHFPALVERVQKNIKTDPRFPLDYWRHPFLASDVNSVIDELILNQEFSQLVSVEDTSNSLYSKTEKTKASAYGFSLSCKDSEGNYVSDCNNAATLSITNPKAVYYGAYIDEDKSDILDAKEGLVNVELGLYPPKFDITSSKETEFALENFGNGNLSYDINLTREFDWNPLTPNGAATWINSIKGLSILVEVVAASVPEVSHSKVSTWIGENSVKLKELSDKFVDKEFLRHTILLIKATNFIIGQIYSELPDSNTNKENIGEIYYSINKITTIADKAIDLLKLDPINIEGQVDYYVHYFFQYESMSEMLTTIRSGNDLTLIYDKISTTVVVEVQENFSFFIMSNDLPFNYDFALKKINGLFTHLETTDLLNSILSVLLNDLLNDTAHELANFILTNLFGAPYKIGVASNKLVPYTWDMFAAPKTLMFPVYNGEIKALPEPTVNFFRIDNEAGDRIYDYSTTNLSNQDYVNVVPGDCMYVSYKVDMPGNFQRGIEATDEFWTWLADYPEVSNFKATLWGRYETAPWSGKYTREKFFEKELEVHTQRDWGIPNNGWNLNWYYGGQYNSLELDDDPANWTIEQSYFTFDTLLANNTMLCFSTAEEIPDQFVLNYNNFNYESTGTFYVNLRRPNNAPVIHSVSSHAHSGNNQIYVFEKIVLSDDYTRAEDITLEVDYGDNIVEILTEDRFFAFSHEYAAQGEYQVVFRAIDDEGAYSEPWVETIYPGFPHPNAESSLDYINFGNIEIGEQASQIVSIRNSGFSDLEIGTFSLTDTTFQITSNSCENRVLVPGETCTYTALFSPLENRDYNGELTILTNAPNGGNVTIQLFGAGGGDPSISTDFERIFKPYQTTDIDGNTITLSTYTPSGVIYGNVKLESGTLDLQGQSLTILGNLIHSGGVLNINGGTLRIDGDYRSQSVTYDTGGAATYTYGSGLLKMMNEADYMLVKGDFIMDSRYGGSLNKVDEMWIADTYYYNTSLLGAGTLEIKGDFKQNSTSIDYQAPGDKYYFFPQHNFDAYGTHRVILSGTGKQYVSFEDPGANPSGGKSSTNYNKPNSHFNILEITNTSSYGVEFLTVSAVIDELVATSSEIVNPSNIALSGARLISGGSWPYDLTIGGGTVFTQPQIIEGDVIVNGSLTLEGSPLEIGQNLKVTDGLTTLGGQNVSVRGNLTITGGTLNVDNGSLSVGGSVRQEDGIFDLAGSELQLTGTWDWVQSNGTLHLNGGKIRVPGDYHHLGGVLEIGGGRLTIAGDYLSRTVSYDAENNPTYSYGLGFLKMMNEADYMLVEGDFIINSRYGGSLNKVDQMWIEDSYYYNTSLLGAGTLEVKGDFKQNSTSIDYQVPGDKYYFFPQHNFDAYGTHRVILSGDEKQYVSFEDPGVNPSGGTSYTNYNKPNSHFNILEITNTSPYGVEFLTVSPVVDELVATSSEIVNPSNIALSGARLISGGSWPYDLTIGGGTVFTQPMEVGGSVYADGSLTLDGNPLTVGHDLIVRSGTFVFGGQDVSVGGNLIIEGGTLNIDTGSLSLGGSITQEGGLFNLNSGQTRVPGDYHHLGGVLEIGGGNLTVEGDYLSRTVSYDAENNPTYSYGLGLLKMINEADYMLVEGDFIMDSRYGGSLNKVDQVWIEDSYFYNTSLLGAGVLEIKGDFKQLSTSVDYVIPGDKYYFFPRHNFDAYGTHRVVLSGAEVQHISFEDPGVNPSGGTSSTNYNRPNSHFNILEIVNSTAEGVYFDTEIVVTTLFDHKNNVFNFAGINQIPDYDLDGFADDIDNCLYLVNPDQLDTDGDLLGNVCDLDDDNDGLPDEWEEHYSLNSTDPSDAEIDSDGDGYSNLQEYTFGSVPEDPQSLPVIDGECGSSAGAVFTVIPTENLCDNGIAGSVNESGNQWYWNCSGLNSGSDVACSATIKNYNVTATSGSGGTIAPLSQTVHHGSTATFSVSPEGGYHIGGVSGCNGTLSGTVYTTGEVTSACTVTAFFVRNPIDGSCGSSDSGTFGDAPSSNLCDAGIASSVSGDGPWTWSCSGLYGGSSSSCSAEKAKVNVPVFSLDEGRYCSIKNVVIQTDTEGATIKYTTDGTIPSQLNGIPYSAPIKISSSTVLNAYAFRSGYSDSESVTSSYTIELLPGDNNSDCSVDLSDVILSMRILTGESAPTESLDGHDVDGDGRVGIVEAIYTMQELSQ